MKDARHFEARQPCVLTVFPHREAREVVHALCAAARPRVQVVDAASPTDAVMTLLSHGIDLVLVDIDGAGDLLPALMRHVRRSAPEARLLGFGVRTRYPLFTDERDRAASAHAWANLPGTLSTWLRHHEQR